MRRRRPDYMGNGFWGSDYGLLLEAIFYGALAAVVLCGLASVVDHLL